MLDPVGIKPLPPLLQILFGAYSKCDRIPAFLCFGLRRDIAHFDNKLTRFVLDHLCEQFMLRRQMIILWDWNEGEYFSIKFVRSLDRKTGKFEVINGIEGVRHGGF